MASKSTMRRSQIRKLLAYGGVVACAVAVILLNVITTGSDKEARHTQYRTPAEEAVEAAKNSGVEEARPGAAYPAISPDGSKLVFVSDVGGSRDLWIADAGGTNAALLTAWPDSDEKDPAWAGDGSTIVFSSNHGATRHNIWVIDADGLNALQLTSDDAEHEHPRYSPDGSSILYLSNSTGKKELWVMNSDGTNQGPIALVGFLVSDPGWSPNGETIVYVGCSRGGPCNLFRIKNDGSGGGQITFGDFQDWNPDWGLLGIIFASDREDSQGLWMVQPDGSGLQQVTAPDGLADLDPRWGPGGSFVFSRSGKNIEDAASDIWFSPSLDTPPEQVTRTNTPSACVPSCGRDGMKITICHVPAGTPVNVRTLCIDENALSAHIDRHGGDYCGLCVFAGSGKLTTLITWVSGAGSSRGAVSASPIANETLQRRLRGALNALAAGREGWAARRLRLFVRLVNQLVAKGALSQDAAEGWNQAADEIIGDLSAARL